MANSTIQAGHIKKVEWAILLCQSDLNNLRDGDWLNLKEELYAFLTEDIEWSFGLRAQNLKNDDVVALGDLIASSKPTDHPINQQDVNQLMALAKKDRKLWNRTLKIEEAQQIKKGFWNMFKSIQSDDYTNLIHFHNLFNLFISSKEGILSDLKKGTYSDLFPCASARLQLYLIAAGLEKSQIQTCPECSQVFVVKRKPRPDVTYHCSKTCAQLASTRRYRGKNKAKVKAGDRDRSHRRYVEKQQQKYGPKVKVSSRPRKARGGFGMGGAAQSY